MKMPPGAQNRTVPLPDAASLGDQPGAARSSASSATDAGGAYSNASPDRRFASGGVSAEREAPGPNNAQAGTGAFSAYSSPEPPFPGPTWGESPYQGPSEPWLDNANRPQARAPETYLGGLNAYCMPDQSAFPGGYGPGLGVPPEEAPVSPLHAAMIALILIAGLAIGVWRWWWIDDKLEAASAKNPAVTASASDPVLNESSSLQSSMDRAYIPTLPDPERDYAVAEKPASSPSEPNPLDAAPALSSAIPANDQRTASTASDESKPPQDSAKASADPGEAKPLASLSPQSVPAQEKKPAARTGKSSPKVAATAKKQRLSEIDRVRTQAYSETSRDRVGNRKSTSSGSSVGPQSERRGAYRTSKVAQNTVSRAEFARCLRIDHIIRREQCKWSLCNNKWGTGACPSY